MAVLHKTTKEYMVPEDLMGFAKGMTRIVEDCPAAVAYLKEKKATPPVQDERLKRFLDTDRMVESLRLYDTCGN